jgi:large subunit ribosomal protein L17
MRHQVAGRKLGRKTAHRLAMFRNMATSLITHGRIRTTLHKAKEMRAIADQMVTLAKQDTLHARRRAFDLIRDRDAVQRLFAVIAPAFSGRNGGYTRIYHIENRPGDNAQMALIEYLAEDIAKIEPKTPKGDEKLDKKAAKAKKVEAKEAAKAKKAAKPAKAAKAPKAEKPKKEPKAAKAPKAEKPKAKKAASKEK